MKIVPIHIVLSIAFLQQACCCPPNRFGPQCHFVCHCLDDVKCDIITGVCPNDCAPGWDGNTCQRDHTRGEASIVIWNTQPTRTDTRARITHCDQTKGLESKLPGWLQYTKNVAFKRRVRQKEGKHSEDGSLAVDDVMGTCSFTKPAVPGWWTVELDYPTRVETIRLAAGPLTNIKNWSIYVGMDDTIFSMTLCTTIQIHGDGTTVKCDVAVLGKYVMVVNKAGPIELCDFRIYVCTKFWFGSMCDYMCRCADEAEVCDIDTGACASGCSQGWSGDGCQTGCKNAYGPDCKYPCGHCAGGRCDHVSGKCVNGCAAGWNGTFCTEECDDYKHGRNCAFDCGRCSGNQSCDRETGKCTRGCQTGYTGELCVNNCKHGYHGDKCEHECGHCETNKSCDPHTGICNEGCRAGWQGSFCKKGCVKGNYGKDCSLKCTNCNEADCDVITGACRRGCSNGYTGNDCKAECPVSHFGQNCNSTCNTCLVNGSSACDSVNGRCLSGCKAGYNGTHCQDTCPWGYYGIGCGVRCGVCKPGVTCDLETGQCPGGCGPAFHGDLCKESEEFADEDGPQLRIFLGANISVVAGIMLVVVVCLVMTWQREHLPDIDKFKVESKKDEICFAEQNGQVMSEEERVEYV